jgi:hypothetical protein
MGKNQYKSLEKKTSMKTSKSYDKKRLNTAREGILVVSGSKKDGAKARSKPQFNIKKSTTPRVNQFIKYSNQSSIERKSQTFKQK